MVYRRLLMVVLMLALGWGGVIQAQEEPAPTEPTVEAPVVEVPTETPTEAPVVEVPTEVVTEVPTEIPTEVPTDAATEVPTEVATEIATEEPTAVVTSAPPIINVDSSAILEATAGVTTAFQFTVSDDEAGLVRVGAAEDNLSTAVVEFAYTAPTETTAPFNTAISLSYTAPVDFVGLDSLKLKAIDPSGITVYFALTINVNPAVEATLEPTVEPTSMPDQVRIINYNPAASEEAIQAMLRTLGAIEISRIPQIGAMKVQISQAVSTTETAIAALGVSAAGLAAGLTSVEPEIIYHIDAFPNDPMYPTLAGGDVNKQWGLDFDDGSIYASEAWAISPKDGTGVIVAVIDSGVDTTHPDLSGKLLAGYDFYNDDANTDDDNGHGTHVSGVIAANTNNAKGIAGIAFNAKILPVKVCAASGSCPSYEIAAGLVFAADKGAKIANLSLGGEQISTTIQGAVQYALSRNVTVIAAAGNTSGTNYFYPASFPGVISVAAHDINGDHASFSTANDRVTISAPGVAIISSLPPELDSSGVIGDGYGSLNGTSMATPHVSGIAALLVADNVATTPASIREALTCSAWDINNNGYDNEYGYGLVQADYALTWTSVGGPNSSNCKVSAPNDLYQNATNIPSVPFTSTQAVDERSVTTSASDPDASLYDAACNPASQTLWFKFKPTASDYYQINTLGSSYSYDTQISVWRMPEEGNFTGNMLGCNDDSISIHSLLNVPLTAGQTYYIMVSTVGLSPALDEILMLDVRRSLFTNNADVQETSPNIFYAGTWQQTAVTGASGGQVKMTTDDNAIAVFTFRGVGLDIYRTVGPTQGDLEVIIDGVSQIIPNRAAVTKRNQLFQLCVCSTYPGEWHQVIIRRDALGPAGVVDIDRIRAYESTSLPTASITTFTDDSLGGPQLCAAKKFCYEFGTFTSVPSTGSVNNKVTQTNDPNAQISFRATGTTITIFRTINPGFGTMDVYVDGILIGDDVSNESTTNHVKVPYVISNLGNYSHVVQIINNAGGTLQFDGAQAANPAALAASTAMTNDNAATLVYDGYWTNVPLTGAVGNTLRRNVADVLEEDAGFTFNYTGNWFFVRYRTTNVSTTVDVYQDDILLGTIAYDGLTSGVFLDWQTHYLGADRLHNVRLVVTSGTFELDAISARRQVVITPSMGLMAETNAAFAYNTAFGAWTTNSAGSLGGYKFQGGSAKRATADGARLTFYVNGTGFMLYTSLNPAASGWEVYVDDSVTPYNITFQDVSYPYIDLGYAALSYRFRPIAYAITGLTPGIHKIELRKWNCVVYNIPGNFDRVCSATDYVDFDGIRAFP